jgi:alpha-tubulin suppressor-like RCC1 family protein
MIRDSQFSPLVCILWTVIGMEMLSSAQIVGNRLSAANHTMFLNADGHLKGSGKNFSSQLGIGDRFDRAVFVGHPNQVVWSNVWCGLNQTVALKPDGSLWTNNQVGIPETSFTRIGSENTWAKVTMGYSRIAALKSNGTLWAWGTGAHGIIGIPLYAILETPTQVGTDADWLTIVTGGDSSLGIKTDGSLWGWGTNAYGTLATGWTDPRYQPTRIGNLTGWVRIAIGPYHSMAIRDDGSLWSWGGNYNGQLGIGSTADNYTPVRVGSANDWLAISVGESHTLALKTDQSLWAWGKNDFGQLGLGDHQQRTSPVRVGTGIRWQYIAGGVNHSCSMTDEGVVYTWGDNGSGQLGDSSSGRSIPSPIPEVEAPEIAASFAQQPQTSNDLIASGTRTFYFPQTATGLPLTSNFTVLNLGTGPLVVHGVSVPAGFSIGSSIPFTVAPGQSFQLPLILNTSITGELAGTLRIFSNDAENSEFTVSLTGSVLSDQNDTDGDGLNDALEWKLVEFGFSWQISDQARLAKFQQNAHRAGLLTESQLRAQNSASPLLKRDPASGRTSFLLRMQRSTALASFTDTDVTAATINPAGNLLVPLPTTETSGFFRFALEPFPTSP